MGKIISPPLAHVIFVLDNSGSMGRYRGITQAAFNVFLQTIKDCKGAEIRLTLIKFGSQPRVEYLAKPIHEIPPMTGYYPADSHDSLYDGVAKAIEVAETLGWGNKVTICIQADGGDNASRTSQPELKMKVEAKRKLGWEFQFMGAGEYFNCFAFAASIGIPAENVVRYATKLKTRANGSRVFEKVDGMDCCVVEDADKILATYENSATAIANFSTGRTQTAKLSS